jgi:NADPH2:quinone reductase
MAGAERGLAVSDNQVIELRAFGDADALVLSQQALEPPGAGEVRVRHTAIGVNFIDVYDRTGLYPVTLPAVLGREAAGVVEALGPNVSEVAVGDRVAYVGPPGAYSQRRNVAAERLVPLPAGISDLQAAAGLLKGLTAQFLLRRTYRVQAGDPVLIHAAAGGVGQLLCQWAALLGAQVIGVVGSAEKAKTVTKLGCRDVIVRDTQPIAPRVRELTGGAGCAVVYDSVGQATFFDSLDCLRPLGMMVTFGNASGPVAPFAPLELSRRGSLFLTRPQLFAYIADRRDLLAGAAEFFDHVAAGRIAVHIGLQLPLAQAADAHRALEGRATQGSIVLLP